jgi:hypothetical protein
MTETALLNHHSVARYGTNIATGRTCAIAASECNALYSGCMQLIRPPLRDAALHVARNYLSDLQMPVDGLHTICMSEKYSLTM